MIVISGREPTLAAVAQRILRTPAQTRHEVRVDLLETARPEDLAALPRRDRLLVTCRRAAEGGGFRGTPAEQVAWLSSALEAGAWAVDLEAAAPDAVWDALAERFGSSRLVASAHRFSEDPAGTLDASSLRPLLDRLAGRPASTLKLAVSVWDVADLGPLRDLATGDGRPLVRIGMGLAGQPSRVAYRAMGSPWTYAAASPAVATAPGQLDAALLGRLEGPASGRLEGPASGLLEGHAPGLLVLLGGAQVAGSPGPAVYNRLAAAATLPLAYLAAPTRDLAAALAALEPLGLVGASVTMPHKAAAASLSRTQGFAARVGAANTLVRKSGPVHAGPVHAGPVHVGPGYAGYNTDGLGVCSALGAHLQAGPRRVLVLGAGGAARGAALALAKAGHHVLVSSRRPEASEALAREVGGDTVAWDDRARADFETLVNATPVGAAPVGATPVNVISGGATGAESPMPETVDWSGRVVLDMVIRPDPTPLLVAVGAGGGTPIPGLAMWAHQGAAQWAILTGRSVSPDRLLALATAALTQWPPASPAAPPGVAAASLGNGAPAQASVEGASSNNGGAAPPAAGAAPPAGKSGCLVLIGPRGAGKSACGRKTADLVGAPFVDLDETIEARGEPIPEIFARGEAAFRAVEREVVEALARVPAEAAVIATGGGVVLAEENRALLRALGTVVYLTAPPEVLAARVAGSDRPPLVPGGPLAEARQILEVRDPIYRALADHVLDTGGLVPEQVAQRLAALLVAGS